MFVNGLFKLSPVFLLAGMMFVGTDALVAAPVATVYAAIVAMISEKMKFQEIVDSAVENVKEMQPSGHMVNILPYYKCYFNICN